MLQIVWENFAYFPECVQMQEPSKIVVRQPDIKNKFDSVMQQFGKSVKIEADLEVN